jgi:MGT family glycosyltransferase
VSRFLITCWPFTGHLLPQMSIAMALRERGHEVAFYTGLKARTKVEAEGFELFGFERVQEQQVSRLVHAVDTGDRRSRPGGGRVVRIFRDWLVETIPDQVADLRSVLAHWKPDVIATDLSMWGPIVVLWETERIPVALSSTFMGSLIPGPDAPAFGFGLRPPRTVAARSLSTALTHLTELAGTPLRRRLDEIRAEYGLRELGESVNRYCARLPLYLVGNIPELDYDRRDLPPSVHYVGNCIWYPAAPPGTSEWLETIPTDRPWVHVTESTLAYGDPFLLRTAILALADEPLELIVTTGEHRDAGTLRLQGIPSNAHVTRWLSHGELLPRCSAVITVGGKATILAALEAGRPLVLVPTTWDKPDNSRRVTETGAGVRVARRRCTPETLRSAVRRVLDDPRYGENARRMASRLSAAPGPAGAAQLLEALVPAATPDRASESIGGRVS